MNCPACGNWQPDDNSTCDFCGAALTEQDDGDDEELEVHNDLGDRAMSEHTAETMPPGLSDDTDIYRRSDVAAGVEGLGEESTSPSDAESGGQLVALGEDGQTYQPFSIPPTGLVVGRKSDHVIFQNDPYLEWEHAEFLPNQSGGTTVRDLSAQNGLFRRLTERTRLKNGVRIRLGDQLLLFERIPEPENDDPETQLVGSPNPGYWCRLVLSLGGGRRAHAQAFTDNPVVIGRHKGAMTFPNNEFISGRHAKIEHVDGEIWLEDLNSTNGTFLELDGDYALRDGDRLMFGTQIVEFRAD